MYAIEKITEKHLGDWLEMMMLLWDDNTYEALKVEGIGALNSEDHGNFICLDNDKGIGFINTSLRCDYVNGSTSSPVGYVEGIFVRSEYRNKGVAKALITKGEEWAKGKGALELGSDCLLENYSSIKFHRSVGFKDVERVVCFIKKI